MESALGPGVRVVAVRRLTGGLTADMDRLRVAAGGRAYDVVLRHWRHGEWAVGLIGREEAALTVLAGEAVPAPRLLALDRSGDSAGRPCLLMSALPGEPLLPPADMNAYVRELARVLARIHDIAPGNVSPTDPHGVDDSADLGWIGEPALAGVVRAVLSEPLDGLPQVFVHGDYQQLNILWEHGRLTGVVDWTYTGRGRREIDVGHCRLALAALFDGGAAEAFLRTYEAEAGVRIDPRADIRALATFGPNWQVFVPRQVTGRTVLDTAGMPSRVEALLRTAARRL